MHLWNEYEGRTIAGAYTLGKLLRSEGRNGFFTTSDTTGHSAVIRLTEAHYDEEELLSRWRQVADVHQDNLIEIEGVGQTTFDGVALTYALMEPDDANLGDVLKERPLTTAEALQVARSVAAALAAVHAKGLVHEHIEPSNVLAVGETVKLRSDCVRECVADIEFNTAEGCAELRRRDVKAFGTLLLQCLTLEKEWTPSTSLPEPFKRIVPRALDSNWTLEQIAAFLDPGTAPPTTAAPSRSIPDTGVAAQTSRSVNAAAAPPTPTPAPVFRPESSVPLRSRRLGEIPEPAGLSLNTIWAVCIASALVIVLLVWHFLGSRPARPDAATTVPSAPVATASQAANTAAQPAASSAASRAASAVPGWYVIAFTYNHDGQAQTKANRIEKRHNGLHPQVFSPSGHAPYLVSLGGPLDEAEARTVWRLARRSGMPRDTFVRRY